MATHNTETSKTIMRSIRFPKRLLRDLDQVKISGESTAGFIVTAYEAEVQRRVVDEE